MAIPFIDVALSAMLSNVTAGRPLTGAGTERVLTTI